MTRYLRNIFTLFVAPLPLAACSPAPDNPTAAATSPRTSSYWCDIIHSETLKKTTGLADWSEEEGSISADKKVDTCYISSPGLGQSVSVEKGENAGARIVAKGISSNYEKFQDFPGKLKLDTGSGAMRPGSPPGTYTGYALFGCSQRTIALVVHGITLAKGRNPIDDMSTLFNEAQRRYAQIANCQLGPAPDKDLISEVTE